MASRKFLAIGGDGTLHYLINGIFSQAEVPTTEICLALIPLGTGNDWSRTHNFPTDTEKVVQLLQNFSPRLQDIGQIEHQKGDKRITTYFGNVAGTGFEAEVVLESQESSKTGLRGALLYIWTVLRTLWSYQPQAHRIQFPDEEFDDKMLLTTIGICRYNGNGMQLVPQADPFDGQFDVSLVAALSPVNVIFNLLKLYNGRIYRHPKVKRRQATQVQLDSSNKIHLEADGEYIGTTPASFQILPASLQIVAPASQD